MNYAVQAAMSMEKLSKEFQELQEQRRFYFLSHDLEHSNHFVVPDTFASAFLNHSDLSAAVKKRAGIHLPFPSITLECEREGICYVWLAQEIENGISCVRLTRSKSFPKDEWNDPEAEIQCKLEGNIFWKMNWFDKNKGFERYKRFKEKIPELDSPDKFIQNFVCLIADPVLCFLQAVTAPNVEQKIIVPARKPRPRGSMIKSRLPLYETRVLVWKDGYEEKNQSPQLQTHHASPREHERAGHYRRARGSSADAAKTIWVRACVVGKRELGHIETRYKLLAKS